MTNLEKLTMCRQSLMDIREQEAEVALLEKLTPEGTAEKAELERQLRCAREMLTIRRKIYPWRMDTARKVVDRLTGRDRQVIWMYYVLGMTIREISKETGRVYRDVLRKKSRALKALEEENHE